MYRFRKVLASASCLVLLMGQALWAEQMIPIARAVTLRVGDSAVVSSLAGRCGRLPTPVQMPQVRFKTGHLGYGAAGMRRVLSCGGPTPAVEVIFIADTPGSEVITLYGDRIAVRVTP